MTLRGTIGPLGPCADIVVDQGIWRDMREELGMAFPPSARVSALVDTGATKTCITRALSEQLDLASSGVNRIQGVYAPFQQTGDTVRLVHLRVVLPGVRAFEVQALEVGELAPGVPVLLGWDVLGHCMLTCDGPGRAFTVELPAS